MLLISEKRVKELTQFIEEIRSESPEIKNNAFYKKIENVESLYITTSAYLRNLLLDALPSIIETAKELHAFYIIDNHLG